MSQCTPPTVAAVTNLRLVRVGWWSGRQNDRIAACPGSEDDAPTRTLPPTLMATALCIGHPVTGRQENESEIRLGDSFGGTSAYRCGEHLGLQSVGECGEDVYREGMHPGLHPTRGQPGRGRGASATCTFRRDPTCALLSLLWRECYAVGGFVMAATSAHASTGQGTGHTAATYCRCLHLHLGMLFGRRRQPNHAGGIVRTDSCRPSVAKCWERRFQSWSRCPTRRPQLSHGGDITEAFVVSHSRLRSFPNKARPNVVRDPTAHHVC